jgi:hypothetical protein
MLDVRIVGAHADSDSLRRGNDPAVAPGGQSGAMLAPLVPGAGHGSAGDAGSADWRSGAALRTSNLTCPMCRTQRLLHRRDVILCRCGFRFDTAGGLSVDHLAEQLASAYGAHRAKCAAEPTFRVRGDFGGVCLLYFECGACGDMHVVL